MFYITVCKNFSGCSTDIPHLLDLYRDQVPILSPLQLLPVALDRPSFFSRPCLPAIENRRDRTPGILLQMTMTWVYCLATIEIASEASTGRVAYQPDIYTLSCIHPCRIRRKFYHTGHKAGQSPLDGLTL